MLNEVTSAVLLFPPSPPEEMLGLPTFSPSILLAPPRYLNRLLKKRQLVSQKSHLRETKPAHKMESIIKHAYISQPRLYSILRANYFSFGFPQESDPDI